MPEHLQIHQSKKPDTIFQKQTTPVSQTHVSNPASIIQRAKINPKSLTHADVMQLQRTIGNRAVDRLLSGIGSFSTAQQAPVQRQEIPEEEEPLQGKMIETIQRQEIPEEEEPLQGKMIKTVQRQEIPEEEETLQGKFESNSEHATCPPCMQRQEIPEEEEPLQGKMIEAIQRQEIPEEEEPLKAKRENNTGMPDNLKAGMENLSGIDMSDVRVHYNSSKPADVGALAYTQGTNIHVTSGQERHLPHEAWHVVQQAQGRVKPTMQLKDGVPVNDDEGLEHEADVMGEGAHKFSRLPVDNLNFHENSSSIFQKKSEEDRGKKHKRIGKSKKAIQSLADKVEAGLRRHVFQGENDRDGNPKGLHAYTMEKLPSNITHTIIKGSENKLHNINWNFNGSTKKKSSSMFPKWMPEDHVCTLIALKLGNNPEGIGPEDLKKYILHGLNIEINAPGGSTAYPE